MTEELPKTRAEARELGSKRYFTGESCKHGHIAERDTKEGKCVECVNGRNRRAHANNKDERNAKIRQKRIDNTDFATAERKKASEYYYNNKPERLQYLKGWIERNLGKRRAYGRAYHKRYPEKTKAYTKAWRAANPEQARAQSALRRTRQYEAEGSYTREDVKKLLELQGRRCAICSIKLTSKYHVDHITPLARGGSNWPTNLQITCPSCNFQKNARDPIEFMQSRGMLL